MPPPQPVDWQPIYLSTFFIAICLIFLYYKNIYQFYRAIKLSLHFGKAFSTNPSALQQLFHGLPHYLLGINHEYGYGSSTTALQIAMKNVHNLYNKTIIVTGGNSGIGLSLCTAFCAISHKQSQSSKDNNPCSIIMASRNEQKSQDAIKRILTKYPRANIRFIRLDLGNLQSIKSFVDTIANDQNIQILVNNAGIAHIEKGQSIQFDANSDDRYEKAFVVNYLGPFILTQFIYDKYMKYDKNECRIINTSSIGHSVASSHSEQQLIEINKIAKYHLNKAYDFVFGYGVSKLFNIIHANMMAQEYEENNVLINSLNPGTSLDTGISEHYFSSPSVMKVVNNLMRFVCKSNDQCAATSMFLACDERIAKDRMYGMYFEDCRVKEASKLAQSKGLRNALKAFSFRIYDGIK